jgi:hypothetical protein
MLVMGCYLFLSSLLLDCYIRISQPLPCLEQQQQCLLTSFLDLC